ncbi:hypothetical protein [Arsenophonus sp.]|uniref:hypothetical protein n=1 Tax=Arsenophonus sp. TaxID=1872640 RepID=UPI003879C6EA
MFPATHKRETILTMAKYMVRVELHDADSKQYEILHERMESLGFYRTLMSDNNRLLKLPDATYQGDTSITAKDICNQVNRIAHPLSYGSPSIIVCSMVDDWEAWLPYTS